MRTYFRTITLFTILSFLLLTTFIIVAISRQPEELKSDLLSDIFIAFLVVTTIDVVMKLVFKLKKNRLWILQAFLLLLAVYIWIVRE